MAGNTNPVDRIPSRIGLNEVEIFTTADLPAPSGGDIVLPSGAYILKGNITLADKLVAGAGATVEITSLGLGATITYTGTDAALGSNASAEFLILNRINIVLTGNGADLLDTDGPAVLIDRAVVIFAGTGQGLGLTQNHNLAFSFRNSQVVGFVDGLTIVNAPLALVADIAFVSSGLGGTPLLSIDAATLAVQVDNLTVTLDAAEEIFDIDAGFTNTATIEHVNNLSGSVFFAAGALDEKSPFVSVALSPPQKSSKNIGTLIVTDNATVTVIDTQNEWTDLNLNAMAVLGSNAELWSLSDSTTGELTYNGVAPFDGRFLAVLSGVSAGSTQQFQFRVVKNGSPLTDGVIAAMDLSNALSNVTVLTPGECVTGDDIRLQVRNVDGTSNVTIEQLSVDIS